VNVNSIGLFEVFPAPLRLCGLHNLPHCPTDEFRVEDKGEKLTGGLPIAIVEALNILSLEV